MNFSENERHTAELSDAIEARNRIQGELSKSQGQAAGLQAEIATKKEEFENMMHKKRMLQLALDVTADDKLALQAEHETAMGLAQLAKRSNRAHVPERGPAHIFPEAMMSSRCPPPLLQV